MNPPRVVASLGELDEAASAVAWRRWQVLTPTVNNEVPLARAAAAAGIPLRTAQRWLSRYQVGGLAGLSRTPERIEADFGLVRSWSA